MNDAADQVPDDEPIKPSDVAGDTPSTEQSIVKSENIEDPDGYVQHPISAIFPAMSDDEFAALCKDIQENGLLVPIDVVGKSVIDGWHRYRACGIVGCPRRFNEITGTINLLSLAASKNLHRRHLPVGARSFIAGEMAEAARGGDHASANFYAARAARSALGTAPSVQNPTTLVDGEEKQTPNSEFAFRETQDSEVSSNEVLVAAVKVAPVTTKDAAKALGISPSTFALGRKVTRESIDDVRDAVRAGKISLNAAAEIAKSPKEEQKSLLQKRLDKGAEKSTQEEIDTIGVKRALKHIKAGRRPDESVTAKQTQYAVESLLNEATSKLAGAANATVLVDGFQAWPVTVTLVNECKRVLGILERKIQPKD